MGDGMCASNASSKSPSSMARRAIAALNHSIADPAADAEHRRRFSRNGNKGDVKIALGFEINNRCESLLGHLNFDRFGSRSSTTVVESPLGARERENARPGRPARALPSPGTSCG
jgi:hypothetical protein